MKGSSGSFKGAGGGTFAVQSFLIVSSLSARGRGRGAWTVESVAYIAHHLKWYFCRWSRGVGVGSLTTHTGGKHLRL